MNEAANPPTINTILTTALHSILSHLISNQLPFTLILRVNQQIVNGAPASMGTTWNIQEWGLETAAVSPTGLSFMTADHNNVELSVFIPFSSIAVIQDTSHILLHTSAPLTLPTPSTTLPPSEERSWEQFHSNPENAHFFQFSSQPDAV